MAGSKFYNCDFHIHTPESNCYKDKSVSPSDIVRVALEKGLDVIAVTDHNTIKGIDGVIIAAEGTGLVVFPGFELTSQGGHIIALFDPSTNLDKIDDALTNCGIEKELRGSEDAMGISFLNSLEVITEFGGIAIAAHADGKKGFVKTIDQGQLRINIYKNDYLLAMELVDLNNLSKYAEDHGRKMACIQSSDAHRLEDIGSRSTLVKMQLPTIKGVKHAYNSPDTRIDFPSTRTDAKYPYIKGIRVDKGFLANQEIDFNENFNCLLGGAGSGKSTIIEFLRFAFDQLSEDKDVKKDYLGKLKDLATVGSTIRVIFVDKNGEEYLVSRTFDDYDNPITIQKKGTTTPIDLDIKSHFPVHAYSQGEALSSRVKITSAL